MDQLRQEIGRRCFVVRDIKAAKKPYCPPSFQALNAGAAKVELETTGAAQDAKARQMLSLIKQQLDIKVFSAGSRNPST